MLIELSPPESVSILVKSNYLFHAILFSLSACWDIRSSSRHPSSHNLVLQSKKHAWSNDFMHFVRTKCDYRFCLADNFTCCRKNLRLLELMRTDIEHISRKACLYIVFSSPYALLQSIHACIDTINSSLFTFATLWSNSEDDTITKICLYKIWPLKPHFYIVKQRFTGVYIIFLFY